MRACIVLISPEEAPKSFIELAARVISPCRFLTVELTEAVSMPLTWVARVLKSEERVLTVLLAASAITWICSSNVFLSAILIVWLLTFFFALIMAIKKGH